VPDLDPVLYLVQQLSELDAKLHAVDSTDNQGEPCQHCGVPLHRNAATIYGFDGAGERTTADCCVRCIPAVATEYFDALYAMRIEVAR
jgi:hypothetical protein